MIPLKLTIEGLYSYRSRQTIDFTNLTLSGLFGIFGGVGSGKSSILEAISFAMYGKSQRLNSRGDDLNYNMMNLKSDKLYIEFEFRSGADNKYKFIVQGKRNHKKYEDVKAFDRFAYHHENDLWMPVPVESIEAITGLNYDNFHRTIIIPQGKFQEFLQLSPSDRTGMLKELFNLSKYDLYDKITRLDGRNLGKIQQISGEMQGVGEVSPEKITALTDDQAKLQAGLDSLKKDLVEKEKTEQQLEILKKLTGDITGKNLQLEDLKRSEPAIKELDRKTREFERITRIFKSDIVQLDVTEKSFAKSCGELNTAREQLKKLNEEFPGIQRVYEDLKKEHDNKDRLNREAEELVSFAEVKQLEAALKMLSDQAITLSKNLLDIAGKVTTGKNSRNDKKKALDELRKTVPDIRRLSDIKAWFTEKKRLKRVISDLEKKTAENDEAIRDIYQKAWAELAASALFGAVTEEGSLAGYQEMIETRKAGLDESLDVLLRQKSDLEIRHKLEEYAAGLHEGKPCPLCGSENHPNILNPTDVATELKIARAEDAVLQDQLKICQKLTRSLTAAQSLEGLLTRQNRDVKQQLALLLAEEKALAGKFTWQEFDREDESRVEEEEKHYAQITKVIAEGEEELQAISDRLMLDEKQLEEAKEELGKTEQKKTAAQSRIDALVSRIISVDTGFYKDFTPEQLRNKAEELTRKHAGLIRQFAEADKKRNAFISAIDSLSGQIKAMEKAGGELEGQLKILREKVEIKLRENGSLELGYVKDLLGREMDIEGSRKKIEAFYREMESLVKYLEERKKELAGRTYDELSHLQLKENIREFKQKAEEMNQEIGRLQKEIATLTTNAKRYAVLKSELEKVELRGKDIAELKNLFRGNGFVNYVSTIYLQNLCQAANERFYKLTRQKLGLELAEDNSFKVRDYMNEGRLRSVKTLSGGQTFQASLSLALSLADSIHKIAGSMENFFFLDEGFGTLDKETLEVAFDTLKSLRKENRIVGVISHVEEMQAEIETYLEVTNDEEHGSIVRSSWEG
jgi:exonuclease SbcC